MKKEVVTVKIPRDPKKSVDISVTGVKGPRCKTVTKGVEKAFGGVDTENRVLTPEHKQHEVHTMHGQHQQEGGS